MKNIRIGLRLNFAFGVLIALSAILAVIGFFRLQAGKDTIGSLINGTYPKILVISEMRESNDMGARNLRNVLLATTPKDKDEKLKRMFEMDTKGAASFKKLQDMATSPEERELLQKISDKFAAYVELRAKVLSLIASDEKDAAVSFMFKPGVPAFNAYNEAVTDFMNFEKKMMDHEAARTFQDADQAKSIMVGGAVFAMILGSVLALLITRSITSPLQQALTVAEAVADGNLTSRIDSDAKDETGKLVRALKRMNENLVSIVQEVRSGTDTVASATTEIAAGNMELSSRTEQQASALEETASSMEEMTATVKQNADNARQANQLANSAVQVAGKGGAVVAQVVDTIAAISESSKKVGNIIEVINGIAFQTNILALNAAVEAARAGEQGKGFAVVAGEVRNLAQRSAAAAKEIKELIEASNSQVQSGTQFATQAGVAMTDIVTSIKRVTDVVSEIAAASQEQTGGIDQINQAIIQIDRVTQQNAALVEEAAAASSAMEEQAETLKQAVSVFKIDERNAARA